MQGWLLEEMSKFTKIGVTTPKHQIQNNFQNNKFYLKSQPQKPPKLCFPINRELLEQVDQIIQSHTTGIFQTTIQKTLKTNYINKTLV